MDKLPINVNGIEKFAGGITKDTTVEDLKFAMLYATDLTFTPDMLDDYGIFEKWQDNERLLDGNIKMYKIVRSWKSLQGDQLPQVKFTIKKRIQHCKKSQIQAKPESKKGFKFCSLSPSIQKTWNEEKINRKSTFVKKQLETISHKANKLDETISSIPSAAWSSDCDESESDEKCVSRKRYATVKQLNRLREADIRRIQQLNNLEENLIDQLKTELKQIETELNFNTNKENDIVCLKSKLIQSLEYELNQIDQQGDVCLMKKSLSCSSSSSSIGSTDTGISSAYSDDDYFSTTTRFETLV